MPGISSRTDDRSVRSHFVSNLDEVSRDWELVLRESHHRMKNTLTLLGASVRRDFTRAGGRDMSVAVDRLERRIVAFGRLYQLLSDNDDLTEISVETFFEKLCCALSEAVLEPAGVRCEASIASGTLPAWQCHRLALMLTELVTNAAKHAFPNKTGDRHLMVMSIQESLNGLCNGSRALFNRSFGNIALDIECFPHGRGSYSAARKQAIAEAKKQKADEEQSEPGWKKIEHAERPAGHLLADATDDDIWRCADEGHQPTQ